MNPPNKIVLSAEQLAWLETHFADTKNKVITERLGISETTLHRLAREMGLTKTKEFFLQCQRGAAEAAKRWWLVNEHTRPRRKLPSCLVQYQYRKGDKPWDRIGRERWKEAVAKGTEKREKMRREDKARRHFGLPQRTGFKVAQQPRAKILARYYLKKHGYILDDENLIAYWTADTIRAVKLEASPRRYYIFKQHPTL